MKKGRYFLPLLVGLLITVTLAEALEMLPVGQALPDLKLADLQGKVYTQEVFQNRPALIVYVRFGQENSEALLADCQLWLSELPELRIVAIAPQPPKASVDLGFPLLIDPDKEVYGEWGVRVFPTLVLIDEQGLVVETKPGYGIGSAETLRGDLEILLGKKTDEQVEMERLGFRIEKSAQGSAVQHFHAGKKLWDAGFPERARIEWEKSVKEDSAFVSVRVYLGKYFLRTGDEALAREHFEVALQTSPSAEVFELMARCLMLQGDLDGAEIHIERSLDLNRRSFDTKLTLAEIYLLQNDLTESEALIEDVLFLKKNHPRAFYLLGRIAESRGDLPGAIRNYRQALDILLSEHNVRW